MFELMLAAAAATKIDIASKAFSEARQSYSYSLTHRFADIGVRADVYGKPFTIEISAYYHTDYNPGEALIQFKADSRRTLDGDDAFVYEVGDHDLSNGTFVGRNSFGARSLVRAVTKHVDLIEPTSQPVGMPPAHGQISMMVEDDRDYYVRLPVANASEAERTAKDIKIVISGRITALIIGGTARCWSLWRSATIDSPQQTSGTECMIGAAITRIAFVRRSTGQVIREWVAPA